MEARWEEGLLPASGTSGPVKTPLSESVSSIRQDVNDLIHALAILGVKRCSQCRQFFNSSDPGALFDAGNLVCYGCVPNWWSSLSAQLTVTDREKLEAKLSSWLRRYHGAEVVKEDRGKLPVVDPQQFRIVVHCSECHGSGKLLEGERCRFCNGFGTVWIVANR
jgi:hypothetical protein